ncbi:sensor histidine kinase [Roseiflexus sp.]|uniref:sensor histidine kinase n=1 Tax=Roseiflexus sp. TaxID=2562120 RepID=UPI00398B0E07
MLHSVFRGLHTRLFLSHMLVIAAGAGTLLIVTLITAPTLHDRLMVAWLGSSTAWMSDPTMVTMERATNAVFEAAMVQALIISGGSATLVAVAISLLVSRRVAQPIQNLLCASQKIAAGHYHERVPKIGNDELGDLALQFNTMAEALERAEHRRVALIGDVAHELRTPLATIEGYAESALDGIMTADSVTWAIILDEVGRLRRLVDDLQELSRVEAKQLSLHLTSMAPATLLEYVVARLGPQFDDKGVTLICDVPTSLPSAPVDPDRITQVLINLLGNALQHTPTGGIVYVTARAEVGNIRFQVRDTGTGIAAEHLPHLFERFYRVDKSRTRATGGAGVGLTICKALVEAHGGRIWGESRGLGHGATFTFTLPFKQHV